MDIEKQTTPEPPKPLLPLWATIPLYIITSFLFMGVFGALVLLLMQFIPESKSVYYMIGQMFASSASSLAAVWIAAIIFLKLIDRQPVSELGMSIKGRWKDCLAGLLFAIVLYIIGFTASLALGAIEITSISCDFGILLSTFCFYFVAASMEEVMVRGYIQGRLMTKMNKFLAMCIASLIFSVLHIANDNITFFALVNLFLAGLLLGASYMYTRNLWFPIFLHTAWNWIQGPILGYEVSGTKMFPSVINLHLPEENIINGGRFGFEGSIICTVLMIIGTALIIMWYRRGGSRTAQA
ncbi:CPBP family intramembrane metalloprotease [Bacteroides sp. 51]|nr:CPBP family intramembrane metalloprotease [Bacteroides sp. 51]